MRRAESIAAAMVELGFQPSDAARSLKTGRTLAIGLVVPDVTNPFFAAVVKGAESVANDAGYSVVLCNTDESPAREHDVLAALRARVDGLLLAPAVMNAETAESLAALRVPVVLVDRTLPQPGPTDAVLVDNAGGATSAARHLLDLGHRTIAHIAGPLDMDARRRAPRRVRRRVRRRRCRRDRRPRRVPRRGWLPGGDAPVRSLRGTHRRARRQQPDDGRAATRPARPRPGRARCGVGDRVRRPPARRPTRPTAHRDRPGHRDPGGGGDADAAGPAERGDVRRGSGRAARDPTDRSSLDGGTQERSISDATHDPILPPPSASAPSTWSSSVR